MRALRVCEPTAVSRRRWRSASLLLAALLACPPTARADVDLTGFWDLFLTSPFPAQHLMTVTQAGTSLSVQIDGTPVATGTIDPVAGTFSVMSSTPACADFSMEGTAAPDGNTMSGTGLAEAFVRNFCFDGVVLVFTASRSLCGDGTIDPGETCDDGNRDPDDCCSPSCAFDGAGAPDTDGDGLADPCDPCPTGLPLAQPRLKVGRYDDRAGNDQLVVTGELPISSAQAAFLDPVSRGFEVRLGATGTPGSLVVTVPPGAYDPVSRQGWTVDESGRAWKFHGADRTLAVTRVRLRLSRDGHLLAVAAKGKRRSFADVLPALPLPVGLVVDPAAGSAVPCGEAFFGGEGSPPPTCELRSGDAVLRCR